MEIKTILVTGASGFLGSYIVEALLAQGHKVIALSRKQNTNSRVNLLNIQADLNDPSSFESQLPTVNYIIHAAGKVSYDPKQSEELYRVNQKATSHLINFALDRSIEKFIYISSASTLRRSSKEDMISENVPGSPIFYSNYSRSKYLGEMEVRRGEAEGLSVSILNPSLIIGFGDWNKGSCNIFKKAAFGMKYYPSGNVGLVMVDDIVKVCLKIINKELVSNENILLNSETWSYKNLFENLCLNFSSQLPSIQIGKRMSYIASFLDYLKSTVDGSERLISKETIKQISQKIKYQSTYSNELIQFELKKILPELSVLCNRYKLILESKNH